MTALFVDNPYAVWRVRLNNWLRTAPLYRDGVHVEWKSLRVYRVRVGGQSRTFRGAWADVRDRIARHIANAKALEACSTSSVVQPVCVACGDGEGVLALRGDDDTPCPLCGEAHGVEAVF